MTKKQIAAALVLGIGLNLTGSAVAKPNANERVEVPVGVKNNRFFLEVQVGTSGPLEVGIDTGAGGLRIWASNLKPNDVEKTGVYKSVLYGAGVQGLEGEIAFAKVKIGRFAIPGKTRIHYVTGHACNKNNPERCDKLADKESRFGFAGTLGLSTLPPESLGKRLDKDDRVLNPLIEHGPYSYILKAPRDGRPGVLIINPSEAEKSRFVKLPLNNGNQQVPFCVNRYCSEAILDTGWPSSPFALDLPQVPKQLGLPIQDGKVVPGTTIPIQFGSGKNSLTIHAIAGKKSPDVYTLTDRKHGVFGFDTFQYIDVLYDFKQRIIGVAAKQ